MSPVTISVYEIVSHIETLEPMKLETRSIEIRTHAKASNQARANEYQAVSKQLHRRRKTNKDVAHKILSYMAPPLLI